MWPADVGIAWLRETVEKTDAGVLTLRVSPGCVTNASISVLDHFRDSAGCMHVLSHASWRLAGMQVLYERCAAVDVGKDMIAVAVGLPGGGPEGRVTHKRTFKTFHGCCGRRPGGWTRSGSPT
jgi:hypothetical protein